MSTLNEIAANHARMAKAKEAESTRLGTVHGQRVASFEISPIETEQTLALHFMTAATDHSFGEAAVTSF